LNEIWERRKPLFSEISRFILTPKESTAEQTGVLLSRILKSRHDFIPRNFLCLTLPTYSTWKFQVDPGTEALEIRLDLLNNLENFEFEISRIRLVTDLPLVITLRSSREGGFFSGSDLEYLEICSRALAIRPDWLDVEISRLTPQLENKLVDAA
jgi:hypothetical protein